MINILYFASFREMLGTDQEQLPLSHSDNDLANVDDLVDALSQRGEIWQKILKDNPHLQIAVNQTVASRNTAINAGDEIAFFPPVTGG